MEDIRAEDKRVIKTKRRIREAFTALLMEKNHAQITVSEITTKAKINRGTFYAHYKDADDLLHQLEQLVLDELQRVNDSARPGADSAFDYLCALFGSAGENSDIYMSIVCRNGDVEFQQALFEELRKKFYTGYIEYYGAEHGRVDSDKLDTCCAFIAAGLLATEKRWLENRDRISVDEIAHMVDDFIVSALKAL